ncbi:MAG: NUMOD1 domain-containing DNA-binding protein [Agriterribacter sp.]
MVTRYDMNGNRIGVYSSLKDAEHTTGANASQILRSTKFKHLSAKGSFWRVGEGPEKIDVTYYWNRISKNLKSISYIVEQYSKGKRINTYPSLKEAMRQTGIDATVIARAIKRKKKTKGDFMWRMKK